MAKVMLRLLPSLAASWISCYYCWTSGIWPPTPQGTRSVSYSLPIYISLLPLPARCSAGPVVHQSCSMPVSSRHRAVDEVHDDGAPAEGLQYDGDRNCATAICNYSGDDKVTTAVADASSICDGWQDETARASSAASERALVAGRFRGDVNGAVVGRVALAPPAPRVQ
jgi:hypothetical protein